jgi:ribonuclease HII
MLYIGIDDAGRGPVIGPMVLAGILADTEQEARLKMLRVRDSKMLTPKRREFLAKEIKKVVGNHYIVKITAKEIDTLIAQGVNLNKIEAQKMAEIINLLTKSVSLKVEVIIDCPSVNIKAWQDYLVQYIDKHEIIKMRCEHKADVNYPIVSAASILAKVTRDDEVRKLKKQYGVDFGSGYPADPLCVAFLKTPRAKELAKIGLIRRSWQTWQRQEGKKVQKKLGEF